MNWQVDFTPRAESHLRRLDNSVKQRIFAGLEKLENSADPQAHCKPLRGQLAGLWRYRIGSYRVIIDFQHEELVILALEIGHRSRVYD